MSKSTSYELVNPYIEGSFKKIFSGKTSLEASRKCYGELSQYIRNSMPKFNFTLRRVSDGKYVHFKVKETMNKNGNEASYTLSQARIKPSADALSNFETKLEKLKHNSKSGGRRRRDYDDDDSELWDSDDSDMYRRNYYPYRTDQPILYYWYDPIIYSIPTYYAPHFVLPLTPLVEVNVGPLGTALWP